jgi:hypothetical protein
MRLDEVLNVYENVSLLEPSIYDPTSFRASGISVKEEDNTLDQDDEELKLHLTVEIPENPK